MGSVDVDICRMTPADKDAAYIDSLPCSLKEAPENVGGKSTVRDALEEDIPEKYIEGKEFEWDVHRKAVIERKMQNYIKN